jgi:DNA-binding protein
MTTKRILSSLGMGKLLKRAGAHRVSIDAKEALQEALEEHADELCAKAVTYSEHAGRRTVLGSDVKLAAKK